MRLPFIFTAMLSVTLTGCGLTHEHRGTFIEADELARIKVKKDDMESVRAILGSPTLTDRFSPNEWVYAYQHTTRRSFMHPDTIKFQTVRLQFSKDGTLTKIAKDERPDIPGVSPVAVSTKTSGHRNSVIQNLFGNFGKIRHKR